MRTTWGFSSAGRLIFGWNSLAELGPQLAARGLKRAFLAADPVLDAAGLVQAARESLRQAGLDVAIFTGGAPEPTIAIANQGIEAARDARPDVVVGLGGGSNMDLAKLVALVVSHGGELKDYFGYGNVPGPIMPLVCVPTTAGTGSEVSHAAVVTDPDQQIKLSTLSQYLRPMLAIIDPELTLTCPRKPTADSGMDALTHAIEAFTATHSEEIPAPIGVGFSYEGKHLIGDLFAERAIALIGRSLPIVVEDLANRDAREQMALAATLAGLAFSNCGVAMVHAMEYPVGGAVHVSHGEGNGMLLPYVMEFTKRTRTNEFAQIAELLGADTQGLSPEAAADQAIIAVARLRERSGLRGRLRELGVTREQLPEFARKAHGISRLMTLTPGQPSEADVLAIYEKAW